MIKDTIKLSDKQIKFLAAVWDKDVRTIRRWLKNNHPMLTHPDSIKIIKNTKNIK